MKKLAGLNINKEFNEMCEKRPKDIHNITLELAKEHSVSWRTIRNEIDKDNLKKAKNRLTAPQQMVYNQLREGDTQSQVAKKLNVTRQNVGYMVKIIKKKGYKIDVKKFKKD